MPRSPKIPPVQRRLSQRDLERAEDLRPRDIFDLHGIAPSTLCVYATKLAAADRPISRLIKPLGGKKGLRIFPKPAFRAWRDCWDDAGNFDSTRWALLRATFTPKAA